MNKALIVMKAVKSWINNKYLDSEPSTNQHAALAIFLRHSPELESSSNTDLTKSSAANRSCLISRIMCGVMKC